MTHCICLDCIKKELLFDKPDICRDIDKNSRFEKKYKLELSNVPPQQVRKILSLLDKIISSIQSIDREDENKQLAINMFQEKKTILLYFLGETELPDDKIEITCVNGSMVIDKSELPKLQDYII